MSAPSTVEAAASVPAVAAAAAAAAAKSSPAHVSPLDLDTSDRSMSGVQVALLSLQSKTLEALSQSVLSRPLVCAQMAGYLRRLGLQLERLQVVHVGGTKGKGSTSAFVERICREHGITTGQQQRQTHEEPAHGADGEPKTL